MSTKAKSKKKYEALEKAYYELSYKYLMLESENKVINNLLKQKAQQN